MLKRILFIIYIILILNKDIVYSGNPAWERSKYTNEFQREFELPGNGTIFTILQDNGQSDSRDKVIVVGTKQKLTSQMSFDEVGNFQWFTPPKDDKVNDSFDVLKAAVFDKCVAVFSKIYGKPTLVIFNTKLNNFTTNVITHDVDAIAMDETFIWTAYKSKNTTIIKPYIHANSIKGPCSKIEEKDSTKGAVKFTVPFSNPTTLISQPSTNEPNEGKRSLYLYDNQNNVFSKYQYDVSVGSMAPAPTIINVGKACDIKFYYYDYRNDETYFIASYDKRYNIYSEKTESSVTLESKNDTTNYCGPFASLGLDNYFTHTGDTKIYRYSPVFGTKVRTPCFNQSNGRIEIEVLNPNDYLFEWDDGSNSLIRENLKADNYTLTYSLKKIPSNLNRKKINLGSPANPMMYSMNASCVGTQNGVIKFNSTKLDGLTYNYYYQCPNCTGSKVNKTYTSNSGDFRRLFGDFTYIFWLETYDQDGYMCSYNKTEITLPNVVIEEPKIEYTNNTCYNSSDAQISILNYNPKKYLYRFSARQNITNTGVIYHIPTGDGSGFNIDIYDRVSKCSSHVNVPIKSPPEPKYPVIFPVRPKCHGGSGTLDIREIPGMKYILTGPGGKTIMPLYVNKTFKYKNLLAGKYHVDFSIENDRAKVLCSAGRINFTLTEPKPVRLLETYIEAEDCTPRSLADMMIYARGGTPLNGTTYFFDNKYSKNDGPYLNVSFWVDGIYKLNVSDANHCTVQYSNVTIKRPSKCQVHNINGVPRYGNGANNNNHGDNINGSDGHKKNKLGLILGLCLGIGIPFLLIGTAVAVLLIKKYGHFSTTRTPRNQPRPGTVPVFMGGKIHNLDNF